MNITRKEILPGVWLNHLRTDKFKTAFMSISLLTQLSRETASLTALIPPVLRRGSFSYPDMEKLTARMDELYGASIEGTNRKLGEILAIGLAGSWPEECFLPEGSDELENCIGLFCEMLLNPATRGGLFLPAFVESEKEKLCDLIRSRINDRRSYSIIRCVEEMCCCEDYSVGRFGTVEDVEDINYKKLTRHYRELIKTSPVEIFYCGRDDAKRVSAKLRQHMAAFPRGEINYDIGTEIRMNALEAEPRFLCEEMEMNQGRLVIGWRLGDCMDDPDPAAIKVFNSLFGGDVNSRLFMNVREKLHLAYDAGSMLHFKKGILLAAAGIDADKFEIARDEIFAQLDAIKRGEFTKEELENAKFIPASNIRAFADSPFALEGFYMNRILEGTDYSPEDFARLIEEVEAEDVIKVANSLECDMIYFLRPEETDGEEIEE